MLIKRLILLAGLSVLFAGCTTGAYKGDQEIDKNMHSYPGDSLAKTGIHYLFGRGVPQNDEKAFYYFNKAAVQGDKYAQNEVAYLYAAGKGTRQNDKQAFFWYEKAANQGLASAQFNLGLLYWHGLATQVNKKLALEWIKRSAAQHFEPAQDFLISVKHRVS